MIQQLSHDPHRNRWWRRRRAEQSVPAKAMSAEPRSMAASASSRSPAAFAYATAFCSDCDRRRNAVNPVSGC